MDRPIITPYLEPTPEALERAARMAWQQLKAHGGTAGMHWESFHCGYLAGVTALAQMVNLAAGR